MGPTSHPLPAPAFAAAAGIAAAETGLQNCAGNIWGGWGGSRGIDTAAELVETDAADFHRAFCEDGRELGAGGLRFDALRRAARLQFRRVDAAQPDQGGDRDAGQTCTRASNVSPSATRKTSTE